MKIFKKDLNFSMKSFSISTWTQQSKEAFTEASCAASDNTSATFSATFDTAILMVAVFMMMVMMIMLTVLCAAIAAVWWLISFHLLLRGTIRIKGVALVVKICKIGISARSLWFLSFCAITRAMFIFVILHYFIWIYRLRRLLT